MKAKLTLGGLLVFSAITNAQTWAGSGTTSGDAYRTDNVGIGTTSPSVKLELFSSASNLTLLKLRNNNWACNQTTAIEFWNGSNKNYATSKIVSMMDGCGTDGEALAFETQTAGQTSTSQKMIIKNNGNVGIGISSPTAKLHIHSDVSPTSSGTNYIGTLSQINLTAFGYDWSYALVGKVTSGSSYYNYSGGVYGSVTAPGSLYSRGVIGEAVGGIDNTAGYFTSNTSADGGTSNGVDIHASAGSTSDAYGLYSSVNISGSGTAWAGYFQGNVYRSGTDNFTSDQKLKKDIKPLEKMLDKIIQLKPSSYIFKDDEEFKAMNLPDGEQMGLIAQDLEKVFPELVTEMHEINKLDADGKLYKIPAFKSVQYISLIPVLISGIQEQQKQIEEQTKTNAELKNLVAIQQQQINDLLEKSSGTTGFNSLNSTMEGFRMDQNIPNPFDGETVISYNLPLQTNKASLNVYDLSGKQIASYPLSKGESSLKISSEKLSSGIYIYSIIADGKIMDSKRMVVSE